ncbi:Malectin [Dirofilaria immitis]|nr:Malectin [Dirofilaria immitis]
MSVYSVLSSSKKPELWFSISLVHFVLAVDNVFLGDNIYYAVNCGGLAHTDLNGIHYEVDPLHIGTASDFGSRLSIMKVDPHDAILYQTERYHTNDLTYTIPLPRDDGEYTLVLKFCEVYFQSSQQKVFDVLLNDEVVIAELDIFKEAKGIGIAYDRLLTFHVENGVLLYKGLRDSSGYIKITFAKGALDNPKINAFYIYRGPKTDIPLLRDISFDEETEGEQEEQELNEEAKVNLRTEINRFKDEPLVEDPYAEQDASHIVQRAVSTVQQHKQQFEGAEIDSGKVEDQCSNEDLRHPANNQMTVGIICSFTVHCSFKTYDCFNLLLNPYNCLIGKVIGGDAHCRYFSLTLFNSRHWVMVKALTITYRHCASKN